MNNKIVSRCLNCDGEFTEEQIAGFCCCPNCKSTHIPADPENDVNIKINLQELKILCMWAENYAVSMDGKDKNSNLRDSVFKIVARIRRQIDNKYYNFPLTWRDEMGMLQDEGIKADLYMGGKKII